MSADSSMMPGGERTDRDVVRRVTITVPDSDRAVAVAVQWPGGARGKARVWPSCASGIDRATVELVESALVDRRGAPAGDVVTIDRPDGRVSVTMGDPIDDAVIREKWRSFVDSHTEPRWVSVGMRCYAESHGFWVPAEVTVAHGDAARVRVLAGKSRGEVSLRMLHELRVPRDPSRLVDVEG